MDLVRFVKLCGRSCWMFEGWGMLKVPFVPSREDRLLCLALGIRQKAGLLGQACLDECITKTGLTCHGSQDLAI